MPRRVGQGCSMPRVEGALRGWQKTITLQRTTETNTNGIITRALEDIRFRGAIQPLSPEIIKQKPEGQRSFIWLQIHAVAGSLNLQTDDRITYNNQRYKVQQILDYSINGYIEYHIIQDYV